MATTAPPVDARTAVNIAKQVRALLAIYAPAWREQVTDPATGQKQTDYLGTALIEIFSRFAEIILQRLNQAPAKNLLAFLDLLGESRLPPQPARAPLSFSLAPGSTVDAVVPPRTQVAAPPAEGEKEPVVFETEHELVVTAAQLVSLFTCEPALDRYADHSDWLTAPAAEILVFQGDRPIEHILYVGHDTLFGYSDLQELRLTFSLESEIQDPDPRRLQWEIWDGAQGITLTPTGDTTANLTKNGEVVFTTGLAQVSEQTVDKLPSRWLRCRLLTPITSASDKQAGRVRVSQLPDIEALTVQVTRSGASLAVETAFTNQLPVDLSKDFFPFGEKPKFGDTLYLTSGKAFAETGSTITLHITLTNPSDAQQSPIAPTRASANLDLSWEFWDGQTWKPPANLQDTTEKLTQSGAVTFTLPGQSAVTTVNGMEKYWVRVRISAGNYGEEARYEPIDPNNLEQGYKFIPATFAPPSIRLLTIDYALTKAAPPKVVLGYNDFAYNPFTNTPFKPFQATLDTRPTLYLGFTLPTGRNDFPNRNLSLYVHTAEFKYDATATAAAASAGAQPRLIWQYGNGAGWTDLTVQDGSENFTRTGLLEWLAPADFAARTEFGLQRYWLRVRWDSGAYRLAPRLSRLLFNTTPAIQAVTVRNEILGSSDGSENQPFRATRAPLLAGQQLEVREPELPSAEERALLEQAGGEDAISVVRDAAGRPRSGYAGNRSRIFTAPVPATGIMCWMR